MSSENNKETGKGKVAVVTPTKPSKASDSGNEMTAEVKVTGDSYLHFPRFPDLCNRDIAVEHYDFVRWAQKLEETHGNMKLFADWLQSDEAVALELEGRGNEEFTFGMHKGKKFKEVVKADPEYHSRYLGILQKKGNEPYGSLIHYIEYVHALELEQRGNEKFTYGQHQGMTFKEIARDDPGYHGRYMRALRDKGNKPNDILVRYVSYFNDTRGVQGDENRKRNASTSPQQSPRAKKPRESES